MNYKELTPEEISDFVINDPALIYMGFSDAEIVYMYEHGKYPLRPYSQYIGIEDNKELIGILRWEQFTDNAISVHPYIASKYQGKGLAKKMSEFVITQLQEKSDIKKIVAFIIEPCEPAIRAVKACGFVQEGFIPQCTMWRKELKGIYIFGISI